MFYKMEGYYDITNYYYYELFELLCLNRIFDVLHPEKKKNENTKHNNIILLLVQIS